MKVSVEYTAQLRLHTGCPSEEFEVPAGATPRDLLRLIAERHGGAVRGMLLRPDGTPAPTILCFIGDQQIAWDQPPALPDGARVSLMSPIAGG